MKIREKAGFVFLMLFFMLISIIQPAIVANAKEDIYLSLDSHQGYAGESIVLSVVGTAKRATWKSSNTKVVRVSKHGVVTLKNTGKATITATVNKKKLVCKINVLAPAISKKQQNLYIQKKTILSVMGYTKKVRWRSSDPSIATVSQKGVVTGKSEGSCIIIARAGKKRYQCRITVKEPCLNEEELTLQAGDEYCLFLYGLSGKVEWRSSNRSIATVSKGGVVKALKSGSIRIVAEMNHNRYVCKLTVLDKSMSVPTSQPANISVPVSSSPTPIQSPTSQVNVTVVPVHTENNILPEPTVTPTTKVTPTPKVIEILTKTVTPTTMVIPDLSITPMEEPTITVEPKVSVKKDEEPLVLENPNDYFEENPFIALRDSLSNVVTEYYGKQEGYSYVNSEEGLKEIIEEKISNLDYYNFAFFIYTPQGLFDNYASEQHIRTIEYRKTTNMEPEYMKAYYQRGSYLMEKLGYDYQKMCARGIDMLVIQKNKDEGQYSKYCIWGFSDTTAAEYRQVEDVVKQIVPLINQGTDYEKAKGALEYLCKMVDYEKNGRQEQSCYGALIKKKSVCEGYSCAYKLLLDALGVPCDIVVSREHAWNVVMVEGQWYVVDVTHCDQSPIEYYKFLLGKDVVCSAEARYVDQAVFSSDDIQVYGYADDSNQCQRELSEFSYGHVVK